MSDRVAPLDIRLANLGDVAVLTSLVDAAYTPWIETVGRRPRPMDDDYHARCKDGQAWLAEQDGELVGALVLEDMPGYLFLHNIAVAPASAGPVPNNTIASPRRGSIRTIRTRLQASTGQTNICTATTGRPALAAGIEPTSWRNADAARTVGADGMIDRSRQIPGGWHLNLFRLRRPDRNRTVGKWIKVGTVTAPTL